MINNTSDALSIFPFHKKEDDIGNLLAQTISFFSKRVLEILSASEIKAQVKNRRQIFILTFILFQNISHV
ncbi:hypothetical protein A2W14_01030 [Candidatus Gottesmanbacteria bacterium RBG_16_37_8]|uniref:Uncharacterized protein n=1 Tax=Candidatus Gottesmanbacteria bacterium RBG_16_37_8 TaxID=1798371 RepID=A0A1F5YQ91_9BACT|nr:MAG: hypothetical protein A2W14_01030 [Candidatus Gottesmanbacteria bacterium RBG_16_37_8]